MSHEPSALALLEARALEAERQLAIYRSRLQSTNEDNLRKDAEIEDLGRQVKSWRYQAEHDMLTDLLRRGVFARRVSNILRGRREDEVLGSCLVLLDVDKFKAINDVFGHPAGDEVLKGIAHVISGEIRADDLACRMGDEFFIFFNGASKEAAKRITMRIADKVKGLRFHKESVGMEVRTSVSYGVAFRDDSMLMYEDLYKKADALMYEMKKLRGASATN